MYTHRDVETKRKPAAPPIDPTARRETDWGWRQAVVLGDDYEVWLEHLGAHAKLGIQKADAGQLTLVILAGVLWSRAGGKVARLRPGQHFASTPGRPFELATGAEGATVLRIQPPGLDARIERIAGTANQLPTGTRRIAIPPAPPAWRVQGSFEERSVRANAAQGLARVVPPPGQPRTAAEVAFTATQHGTNLAPVVPEP